jgi:hypothetical protein
MFYDVFAFFWILALLLGPVIVLLAFLVVGAKAIKDRRSGP